MFLVCQLVLTKDESTSTTTVVQGAGSLMSPKGVQEEASFMGKGKGGEQQLGYHPNVYASQPHTPFSGG
jgi:YTH domain-containing family protein